MRQAVSSPESLLRSGLKELSVSPSGEQVRLFLAYLTELKKWSRAYNLTSLKTDEDIVIKHFLDSLLYLKVLPQGKLRMLDVGSGAGFPGIPLKIIRSEIALLLLEPSWKKANFLRHIIRTLGLGPIEIIHKRIEELESMTVDVAVTRGLFTIQEFFEKASPFVGEGGSLILSKGPRVFQEIQAAKQDLLNYEGRSFTVPLTTMQRFIIRIVPNSLRLTVLSSDVPNACEKAITTSASICINAECRLRKSGCRGFEGCPGFKARM